MNTLHRFLLFIPLVLAAAGCAKNDTAPSVPTAETPFQCTGGNYFTRLYDNVSKGTVFPSGGDKLLVYDLRNRIIKMDTNGNVIWDKMLGNAADDNIFRSLPSGYFFSKTMSGSQLALGSMMMS